MRVARAVDELEPRERAVAIGTFDGVHLGHRRVLDVATGSGLPATVVTFHPHPRTALGNRVELLTSLERRLELLDEAGIADTLVLDFSLDFARLEPEEFAERVLRAIGTRAIVAGDSFRFGRGRRGDLELLRTLGFEVRAVPLVAGFSSSSIRKLLKEGETERAASLLGRPAEVEGIVVAGDARGGTLGFPTANLRVDPELLVPALGIYAGFGVGHRELRIEAFLLDFDGDLYGRRLVIELWSRLRDEQVFASEGELVAQIARDVEETRRAERPA